jgi:hypothetical protein
VLWLAQRPSVELRTRARAAAATLGLPLEERTVGDGGLERQLEKLIGSPTTIPGRAGEEKESA